MIFRSSPTVVTFFIAAVEPFDADIAISDNFVLTAKNLTECLTHIWHYPLRPKNSKSTFI